MTWAPPWISIARGHQGVTRTSSCFSACACRLSLSSRMMPLEDFYAGDDGFHQFAVTCESE